MAPSPPPLLSLGVYITLVLSSVTVQNSIVSEPINHNSFSCLEGYSLCNDYDYDEKEMRCCDINECGGTKRVECGEHTKCNNTEGSYHCSCIAGFKSDTGQEIFMHATEATCNDIDECASNPCGQGAICKNYAGGFWCPCLPGYISYTEIIPGGETKNSCKPFSCSASSSNNCSDKQTFICNFTAQLDNICNSVSSAQSHRDKEKLLKDMLHLLDEQVSASALKEENKEERHRKATELMREMESWLRHFSITLANTISIESSKGTELDMEIRTAGNHRQSSVSLLQNDTQMELSWDVSDREDNAFSLVGLLSYQSLGPLLTGARIDGSEWEAGQASYQILSKVAAAFVSHENTMSLNISVNFTFNHTEAALASISPSSNRKREQRLICAFWKPLSQSWSAEGCELLESNGNSTRCKCNHLTSFAVLMAFYEVEDLGLEMITRIGLIFSLICLFLSILTFLFCRSIRGIRTTIHLHLCLTLFAAYVIFLVGAGNTINKTACAIVAGLLHYFFLSAFCWMLLEGVELYLMVVQVFRTHNLKHWHHMLVGYGVPAVVVGIAVAINHQGYGTTKHCWLSMERGFLWSFLAPVSFIILINAVIFVVTIWKLIKKFADINPDMNQLKKQKVLVITAIAQLCILGTTWIFGMFQFSDRSLVISYIFTILNSVQGIFIFVLHCLLKKQVREDYCRLFCQHRSGKRQSSDKYSEFNSTATFNTLRPQKSSQESGM